MNGSGSCSCGAGRFKRLRMLFSRVALWLTAVPHGTSRFVWSPASTGDRSADPRSSCMTAIRAGRRSPDLAHRWTEGLPSWVTVSVGETCGRTGAGSGLPAYSAHNAILNGKTFAAATSQRNTLQILESADFVAHTQTTMLVIRSVWQTGAFEPACCTVAWSD